MRLNGAGRARWDVAGRGLGGPRVWYVLGGQVSEDMLRLVVDEAERSEGIKTAEGRMIKGVLDMQDIEVSVFILFFFLLDFILLLLVGSLLLLSSCYSDLAPFSSFLFPLLRPILHFTLFLPKVKHLVPHRALNALHPSAHIPL